MAQKARPVIDLVNDFFFARHAHLDDEAGEPPLWKQIDERTPDDAVTFIRTNTAAGISAGSTDFEIEFAVGMRSPSGLFRPSRNASFISSQFYIRSRLTKKKAADGTISVRYRLEQGLQDSINNKDAPPPITIWESQEFPVISVYPNFETHKQQVPQDKVNAITEYNQLSLRTIFHIKVPFGSAGENYPIVTWQEIEIPTNAVNYVMAAEQVLANHKSLMKAVAHQRLLRMRDERINLRVVVTPASAGGAGLLSRLVPLNLHRWSNLTLQIMSGTISFKENTTSILATNDIFSDAAYREFVGIMQSRLERAKLLRLLNQEKNRNNIAKRTQPYEDSLPVMHGGMKGRMKFYSRPVKDGQKTTDIGIPPHIGRGIF